MEIIDKSERIASAYEAMINDIFWDGKAIGIYLPLPVITEINEIIEELKSDQQLMLKMHYGLDGEAPLACSAIARTINGSAPNVETSLAMARSSFAYKLVHEHGFDYKIFEMSRAELINTVIEAKRQLRLEKLKSQNLRTELAAEQKHNAKLKHEEQIQQAGEPYNIPLAKIGLKNHTLDALRRKGWTHINDVYDKTERELLFLYRFGQASLDDLNACLKPYGLEISR